MSPSFNSGVGCALIISLAIDQIFCFAPSIRPPMEPVVSSTKQTSIRGLDWSGAEDGKVAAATACPTTASLAEVVTSEAAINATKAKIICPYLVLAGRQ